MRTWKSKLFADDRLNFYAVILMGLVVCIASAWFMLEALEMDAARSPVGLLLVAIYCVVLGHLALALTSYLSRLAKRLDGVQQDESGDLGP